LTTATDISGEVCRRTEKTRPVLQGLPARIVVEPDSGGHGETNQQRQSLPGLNSNHFPHAVTNRDDPRPVASRKRRYVRRQAMAELQQLRYRRADQTAGTIPASA
jgi:hypothetical protein